MPEVAMLVQAFALLPEGAYCFTTQCWRFMAEHAYVTLQHNSVSTVCQPYTLPAQSQQLVHRQFSDSLLHNVVI